MNKNMLLSLLGTVALVGCLANAQVAFGQGQTYASSYNQRNRTWSGHGSNWHRDRNYSPVARRYFDFNDCMSYLNHLIGELHEIVAMYGWDDLLTQIQISIIWDTLEDCRQIAGQNVQGTTLHPNTSVPQTHFQRNPQTYSTESSSSHFAPQPFVAGNAYN